MDQSKRTISWSIRETSSFRIVSILEDIGEKREIERVLFTRFPKIRNSNSKKSK